jgi:hypothetical protein
VSKDALDISMEKAWTAAVQKLRKHVEKGRRKTAEAAAHHVARAMGPVTKTACMRALGKAAEDGTIPMDMRTAIAFTLDKGGPGALTETMWKALKLDGESLLKAARDTDLNADMFTTSDDGLAESGMQPPRKPAGRTPGKDYSPGGTLRELSHEPVGVGPGREHLGQRHPEDHFLQGRDLFDALTEPDMIEQLTGRRHNGLPLRHLTSAFDAQAPETSQEPHGGDVSPFGGHHQRPTMDSYQRIIAQSEHEPDQAGSVHGERSPGGMVSPEHGEYKYWSTRHARENVVSAREVWEACPHAVNDGRITFEESTFLGNRAERGLPVPEALLRKVLDGRPGER